jgi:RNA polymerase sigma factor (sigma-70 family)
MVDFYSQVISSHPVLTDKEAVELVNLYQSSNSEVQKKRLKEKIVNHNLRMVIHLSNKIRCPRANSCDLIQEGIIGLMSAIEKFEASAGSKFSSYAYLWVKAYMLRYTMKNYFFGKFLTSDLQKKMFWKLKSKRNKLGNIPYSEALEKLAEEFKCTTEEVDYILVLLDGESTMTTEDGSQMDVEGYNQSPEEDFSSKEIMEKAALLKDYIKMFNEKQAKIIEMRWLADSPKTMEEIASEIGVTKQRVCQIENQLKNDFGQAFKTLIG